MKKNLALILLCALAISTVGSASADDENKVVKGAKAIGRGILWGPKKIAQGMKKGCQAIGSGCKKVVGR